MNTIGIDFASPGLRRGLRGMTPLTRLAVAGGLALGIWSALCANDLLGHIAVTDAALSRISPSLKALTAAGPVVKKAPIAEAQATAVNAAVAQLNIPWRDLLDAVESATPKDVALLSLEPDAHKDILRGVAEAKTSDDMLSYIEQLKKPGFFDIVVLTKHEINEQDPNKPLRFQFEAHWQGEAR